MEALVSEWSKASARRSGLQEIRAFGIEGERRRRTICSTTEASERSQRRRSREPSGHKLGLIKASWVTWRKV